MSMAPQMAGHFDGSQTLAVLIWNLQESTVMALNSFKGVWNDI